MYWSIQQRMAWQVVAGRAVLVDLDEGTVAGLNEVGTFVWERLEKGSTGGDIVEDVSSSYGIPRSEAERDVERFIRGLEERGWVKGRTA